MGRTRDLVHYDEYLVRKPLCLQNKLRVNKFLLVYCPAMFQHCPSKWTRKLGDLDQNFWFPRFSVIKSVEFAD
jgi:hypothetical protein